MLPRLTDLAGHSRHTNPSTMGIMGCGANPSWGIGTLVWLYLNGNPLTYCSTCFRNSMGVLCLSRKCREMAVGSNARLHLGSMQINTPYSTFNATNCLNAWGMGSAMLLAGIFDGLNALYGPGGCVGGGLGLTRLWR